MTFPFCVVRLQIEETFPITFTLRNHPLTDDELTATSLSLEFLYYLT